MLEYKCKIFFRPIFSHINRRKRDFILPSRFMKQEKSIFVPFIQIWMSKCYILWAEKLIRDADWCLSTSKKLRTIRHGILYSVMKHFPSLWCFSHPLFFITIGIFPLRRFFLSIFLFEINNWKFFMTTNEKRLK
jgi:hypothetical protein